jgi:predicted ABC-type ATPase
MATKPELYVIAGSNGAGKTTFAREFLPHFAKCPEFVNADLIAGGLSPFSAATAALEAGRIMLKRIDELASHRRDFAFETFGCTASNLPCNESATGCAEAGIPCRKMISAEGSIAA